MWNPKAGAKRQRPKRRSSDRFRKFRPEGSLLESLSRTTRRDALAFVARRPYENVYVQWVLEGGHGPHAPETFVLNRDLRGAITGVLYAGAQFVVATDDDASVDAFSVELRRHQNVRSIVGPKSAIDRLWSNVRAWHRAPLVMRERQPIYALQPNALTCSEYVDVRQATVDEADLIAEQSGEMMLGELGYDPRRSSGFHTSVQRAIANGMWWVWIVDGELRFQCNIGSRTRQTAQIQGVWTPPTARGHGYATLALGSIARQLLQTNATLSLYVNDFNTAAIALYERTGFVRVGDMSTLIFP